MHARIEDSDKGWGAVFKRVKNAGKGRVKVGVLADTAQGGAHEEGSSLTVAEIAAVLHFGTSDGHIPPRPFLAMAFDQNREELAQMGARFMAEVLFGDMTEDRALGLMGAKLAAEAKKTITIGNQLTPNAPATIKAKGSDRPLVDTGRLLNAITWMIAKEDSGHGH